MTIFTFPETASCSSNLLQLGLLPRQEATVAATAKGASSSCLLRGCPGWRRTTALGRVHPHPHPHPIPGLVPIPTWPHGTTPPWALPPRHRGLAARPPRPSQLGPHGPQLALEWLHGGQAEQGPAGAAATCEVNRGKLLRARHAAAARSQAPHSQGPCHGQALPTVHQAPALTVPRAGSRQAQAGLGPGPWGRCSAGGGLWAAWG